MDSGGLVRTLLPLLHWNAEIGEVFFGKVVFAYTEAGMHEGGLLGTLISTYYPWGVVCVCLILIFGDLL